MPNVLIWDNAWKSSNRTPIFDAKTAEMAKLLLKYGADPKIESEWSSTPLKQAIKYRHIGVVDVLLTAGVKLDFDAAIQLGKTQLVQKMLEEKPWLAKPPAKPLYHAASDGNLALVKLLLQHGADPDLDYQFMNISGPYTPVSNAVTNNHYEIAKVLLEYGGNPNASGGRNHSNLFLFTIAYLDVRFTELMLELARTIYPRHSCRRHWRATQMSVNC